MEYLDRITKSFFDTLLLLHMINLCVCVCSSWVKQAKTRYPFCGRDNCVIASTNMVTLSKGTVHLIGFYVYFTKLQQGNCSSQCVKITDLPSAQSVLLVI